MICVSSESNLYSCSSTSVAELFIKTMLEERGENFSVSIIDSHKSENGIRLIYDLGGIVFMSDSPIQIKLNSNSVFEFKAQHWTSLKFAIKQALKTDDQFIILDGRWTGLIISREEAKIVWEDLHKNNDKYVGLEGDVLEKHSRAIESLRQTPIYAERKVPPIEVQ